MSAPDIAFILDRLRGSGPTALNVHDSKPASPVYPYVIVYADGGVKSSDREADERITHAQGWQTTTVGVSAAQCRAALNRVNDRLENWTPTAAGWSFSKVEHEGAQPIRPDESLPDRVVYYATDQWSTVADPA